MPKTRKAYDAALNIKLSATSKARLETFAKARRVKTSPLAQLLIEQPLALEGEARDLQTLMEALHR